MDKAEVEKEVAALLSNGYITKKNRLTSKGLEFLS
jgi:predicted transcriptional regulator